MELPGGRERELRIVAVTPPPTPETGTADAAFGVEAA